MLRLAIDFEALFQSMPTPFMIVDQDLRFVAINDAFLAMTARTREDLTGVYVFDAFPENEERQTAAHKAFMWALAGNENIIKRNLFAIDRPGVGRQDAFWDIRNTPLRNVDGDVVGVLQYAMDVSAEVEAERMRDVISQEFDHRVRNILAKVAAMARQTARHTTEISDFLADFERRIAAMARTHELLIKGGWAQLGLRTLIDSELQPFADRGQVQVTGENVILSSRVSQALGLALHELASNAAKYGALSHADGRLQIFWDRDNHGGVTLHWREAGRGADTPAAPAGFGSTIIDRVLPLETDAIVTRQLTEAGLSCTIALPDPIKA